MALSDDARSEITQIVQESLLASAPGLFTRQFFPFLGAGRNTTGRVPACSVYHNGTNAANSLSNTTPGLSHQSTGNWVAIRFTTEDGDTGGMHSTTTNLERVTIVDPGWYAGSATAAWDANSTGVRGLRIQHTRSSTTTTVGRSVIMNAGGVSGVDNSVSLRPFPMQSGDYLTVEVFQNSGGNLSLLLTGNTPGFGLALVANV